MPKVVDRIAAGSVEDNATGAYNCVKGRVKKVDAEVDQDIRRRIDACQHLTPAAEERILPSIGSYNPPDIEDDDWDWDGDIPQTSAEFYN
jgi:hypothetical protein